MSIEISQLTFAFSRGVLRSLSHLPQAHSLIRSAAEIACIHDLVLPLNVTSLCKRSCTSTLPSTFPTALHPQYMATMLGKRRSKRQSADDAKSNPSDGTVQENPTNDSSMNIDLSGIPAPPASTSRSDNRFTRDASPSQSLLDRYQRRLHGMQTTRHSSLSSALREQGSPSKPTGKLKDASDELLVELGPASLESVNEPITPGDGMPMPNKSYDEFDFGLAGPRKTGMPPLTNTNDATITQPPRRQTRSQVRAEQRKDSVSASESEKNAVYKPRSLTIRKVHDADWTPSPPQPAVAFTSSQAEAELMASLASLGLESNTNTPPQTATSSSIVHHAKIGAPLPSNLRPSPLQPSNLPKATATTTTTKRPPLPPPHKTKPPCPPPAIPINPPAPPAPSQLPGYIWLSTHPSSSLPTEPWSWLKRWTCCQCAHQDPLGQGRAAQTMVEQRVCSRLVCGHLRCARGCRVVRDGRFEGLGVFALV